MNGSLNARVGVGVGGLGFSDDGLRFRWTGWMDLFKIDTWWDCRMIFVVEKNKVGVGKKTNFNLIKSIFGWKSNSIAKKLILCRNLLYYSCIYDNYGWHYDNMNWKNIGFIIIFRQLNNTVVTSMYIFLSAFICFLLRFCESKRFYIHLSSTKWMWKTRIPI